MNTFLGNELVLKQQLALTPKMVEELKILQMSDLDLVQYINRQIIENPLLEAEIAELPQEEVFGNAEEKSEAADSYDLEGGEVKDYYSYDTNADRDDFTEFSSRPLTLREHLTSQLQEIDIHTSLKRPCKYIIECIDDDGYLNCGIESIASVLKISKDTAKKALKVIQSLEPSGVGARCLKETLLLQLNRKNQLTEAAKNIITNYLEQLAQRKYGEISCKTGLTRDEIVNIHGTIKGLDPRPGRMYSNTGAIEHIVPELELKEIDGEYIVTFSNEKIYNIRISDYYKRLIGSEKSSSETNRYLRGKLAKAKEVIWAIEQRKQTILNVASCIIGLQTEFFKKGHQHLKPLKMKAVADMVGIHESTVSRTVNCKFIQTPRGIFELKFFFSSKSDSTNEGISANGVKKLVSDIVDKENKLVPYSDEQIRKELEKSGIRIARRTVAKYREMLNILPVAMRKVERNDL